MTMGVDFFLADMKKNISEFIDLQEPDPDGLEYFTDGEHLYSQAKSDTDHHHQQNGAASTAAGRSRRTSSQDSLYGSDGSDFMAPAFAFKVTFDCHQYPADSLDVKLEEDYIVVTFRPGSSSQEVVRRCPISGDIEPDTLSSSMDPDSGMLTVTAERKGTSNSTLPVHVPFNQPFPVDDASDGYMSA